MTGPRAWLLLAALRVVAAIERGHGDRTRAWNAGHHGAVSTRRSAQGPISATHGWDRHTETPETLAGPENAAQP